jgi:hypothetical protein
LRREQTRAPEGCASQVGAERPGLVQGHAVEFGAGQLCTIETRRLELDAPQVEVRQIQPVEALCGEIEKSQRTGFDERRLDFGPRHIGLCELLRFEVEKPGHVLPGGDDQFAHEHDDRQNGSGPTAAAHSPLRG